MNERKRDSFQICFNGFGVKLRMIWMHECGQAVECKLGFIVYKVNTIVDHAAHIKKL